MSNKKNVVIDLGWSIGKLEWSENDFMSNDRKDFVLRIVTPSDTDENGHTPSQSTSTYSWDGKILRELANIILANVPEKKP